MVKVYKISKVGDGAQGKRNWLCGVELVEVAVVGGVRQRPWPGSFVLLFIAVDTEGARQSAVCKSVDKTGKRRAAIFAMPIESALAPKS